MKNLLILPLLFLACTLHAQDKPLTPTELNSNQVVKLSLASWLTIIENVDSKRLADSVRVQIIPQFTFWKRYTTDKVFRDSIDRISVPLKRQDTVKGVKK